VKSIALLARKGGAGKTTVAIHMGVLAQASGRRVLFVDLDPQRSLSVWWHSRVADTPALVEADARRLSEFLRDADASGYDLAVIDTPPAVTFDTARVSDAVDLVLIPLRPSILDIYAVAGTADVVRATKTDALMVLNACQAGRGESDAPGTAEARKALASIPIPLAAASIGQRLDYTRALNDGEAVNEFAPESKAAAEMQALWHEVHRRFQ
jgi:chromosome partitioning protein